MSRSRRKTPMRGVTTATSEKDNKTAETRNMKKNQSLLKIKPVDAMSSKLMVVALCFAGLTSCESDVKPDFNVETKTADFDAFELEIPVKWTQSTMQGYDSFVGQVETEVKEKVYFDLGWYSNQLNVDESTHEISFTTIDGKTAKLVRPKTPGTGTTGVYFNSVDATGKDRFQMSGEGLSADSERLLLLAFKSLHFKK